MRENTNQGGQGECQVAGLHQVTSYRVPVTDVLSMQRDNMASAY